MASPSPHPLARRRGRRDVLRLGAGVLAAGLLAACTLTGDDDEPDDAPRSARPDAPAALPFAPASTVPSAASDGMLRLATIGEPAPPPALVYSTLVAVDPRDARVHADLAEAAEQADGLTVAFTLVPHAVFHPREGANGGPHAIHAAEIARDFAIRADAGEFLFTDVIEEAQAVDALTLRLRLAAPFGLLLDRLGDAEAAGVRADAPSTVGVPLGSGPFIPERDEDGGLTLHPHDAYHRPGLPLLRAIHIASAERERTIGAAFAASAIDLLPLRSPEHAERADERADASVLARGSRRARGLGLSLVGAKGGREVRFHRAFQDQRVRRAVSLALDRDALAAYDESVAAGLVGPAFAADALGPADDGARELFRHDPAEAAKLLSAAGHEALAFTLESPRAQPLRGLAQLVGRQLTEAGFNPSLDFVDDARLQSDLEQGDFQAILFELEPVRSPDVGLRVHMSGGLGGLSPWGYSNPVYDDAVRAALSLLDPAERAEASRAAQRLLIDDAPAMLPLPEPVERVAVAGGVGGYEYDAYDFNERGLAPLWRVDDASARAPGGAA